MNNRSRDLLRCFFLLITVLPLLIPAIAQCQQENSEIAEPFTGEIITIAGTGTIGFNGDGQTATETTFSYPGDVAIDADGSIYIADLSNDRIRKVDAVTKLVTTIAGGALKGYIGDDGPAIKAGLENPGSIAIDGNGNIYIADTGHNRIRV